MLHIVAVGTVAKLLCHRVRDSAQLYFLMGDLKGRRSQGGVYTIDYGVICASYPSLLVAPWQPWNPNEERLTWLELHAIRRSGKWQNLYT